MGSSTALAMKPFSLKKDFSFREKKDVQLKILATNWGFNGTLSEFCQKAKDEGYDGVEIWLPKKKEQIDEFLNITNKLDLDYVLLTGSSGKSFQQHLDSFQSMVERAIHFQPLAINCHAGKDYFSREQVHQIFNYSIQLSQKTAIPIYHETHRGRVLFAAHIAQKYLQQLPELLVTLDISHWCCVAESLLQDQEEAVDLALDHTGHIHARVGFEEGPQISEPRAPEFKKAVEAHFNWWDKVVQKKAEKRQLLSITTEFGPPNYMWNLPYTQQPLANLWEVNAYMMRLWRERYQL